jgi:hypothetical protein
MAMLPNIGAFQGQNHGSWSDDRSKSSKVDVRCGFAEQQPVCHIRLHEASYFFLLLFHAKGKLGVRVMFESLLLIPFNRAHRSLSCIWHWNNI